MTARTREQRHGQLEQLAREAFADHEGATKARASNIGIAGAGCGWHAGRVAMRRPGSSFYAVEVVWLRHGRIIVHGDIAPVIVEKPGPSFREAVHSLATSYVDYFAGKVNLGEREMASAFTVDAGVLAEELRAEIEESNASCDARGGLQDFESERVGTIRYALEMAVADGDLDGAKRHLYESGEEAEWVAYLGRVIAPRVYYAHAALKRLDEISG